MDPLSILPDDVLLCILSELDISDVNCLGMTCHTWYDYVTQNSFVWRNLCKRHCNWRDVLNDRSESYSWRDLFWRHYGPHKSKQLWKSGVYSSVKSYNDLPCEQICAMDRDSWGDVFQLELSR